MNRREGVSYGHVYQFSFYIEIESNSGITMVICGLLTGYRTTNTSDAIPTEAEVCVRTVGIQTPRIYAYSSVS